jgi:integrase/recombinase XerD
MAFTGIPSEQLEQLAAVLPRHVAAWRDSLQDAGLTNSSVRRKMTVLRSLFSYLQTYGYTGANPAHSDFVEAPPVPRDGKTVGLSPEECRRLLDAPDAETPVGLRDRALLAVLAYTGCRVGELVRLKLGSYKTTGGHKVLEIHGKGGNERRVPLHRKPSSVSTPGSTPPPFATTCPGRCSAQRRPHGAKARMASPLAR